MTRRTLHPSKRRPELDALLEHHRQPPDMQEIDAREIEALRKLRDKAAEFLAGACDEQPTMSLDLAWSLGDLSDAISAADEWEDRV